MSGLNLFGIWNLDIICYLLFVIWCLEFFVSKDDTIFKDVVGFLNVTRGNNIRVYGPGRQSTAYSKILANR